jgi:hypothetical protein
MSSPEISIAHGLISRCLDFISQGRQREKVSSRHSVAPAEGATSKALDLGITQTLKHGGAAADDE